MITAVDTNVIVDVFAADPEHGPGSREALRSCLGEGAVIACEVVWAELASGFPSAEQAAAALDGLGVTFSPMQAGDALAAGDAFRAYRQSGGHRERVVADFLIAAHAQEHADRLLSRDRGFTRTYFGELSLLDPARPS